MVIVTMTTAATRRASARGKERRREILEAAAAVFARRGYHQARTREIAEEAGIAEGSIYNYFSSKRELLLAMMDQIVTESVPWVYDGTGSEDLTTLAMAFLHDRLDMLERNQQLLKSIVPEMINDEELRWGYIFQVIVHLANALAPLQQKALATGELRQFNPRVLLPAIAGAVVTAFVFNEMVDLPLGKTASREELAEELMKLFMDGLSNRAKPNTLEAGMKNGAGR